MGNSELGDGVSSKMRKVSWRSYWKILSRRRNRLSVWFMGGVGVGVCGGISGGPNTTNIPIEEISYE